MVFGKNTLVAEHSASKFAFYFNAIDALDRVDKTTDSVKVSYAKEWAATRTHSAGINDVIKPFDWTFSSDYTGTLINPDTVTITEIDEEIDMEKLMQRDAILHYSDVLLYEDELADNGCSIMNVKIRVMPGSFFILLRFFLRVDGVFVRVNDTRIFHEFSTNYILREFTSREQKFSVLNERCAPGTIHDLEFYSKPQTLHRLLDMTAGKREKIAFNKP
ncbi:hypothetical protein CAOG_005535 [Capsaspora owczarzaki ATCC 30864]|uniref:TIP41-like protein n=2 Tax=Capsaspora owczarzaki (strain ATCC 30864) TaxID=595528 RepID=A0A0D2WSB1_CAPO3|nr:hypothetical protein CAOG_005535 [Capsaspora owczarzaki ATCC 30864]